MVVSSDQSCSLLAGTGRPLRACRDFCFSFSPLPPYLEPPLAHGRARAPQQAQQAEAAAGVAAQREHVEGALRCGIQPHEPAKGHTMFVFFLFPCSSSSFSMLVR